jgi:hypothetical protein
VKVVGGRYDGVLSPVPEGLVLESTYVWGMFRSRSTEPTMYRALRRMAPAGTAWPARLLLQGTAAAGGFDRLDSPLVAARSVDGGLRKDDGGAISLRAERADHAEAAEPCELDVHDHELRWSEGALLDVRGREVEPGLQWQLAPEGDVEGMHYASRIFLVAGELAGSAVDGFVGIDEVHLAPGRHNYLDDPLTLHHLSAAWCTWATAYDDGTVEAGHTAFGPGGFAFGLRAGAGTAHVSTRVDGDVELDANGCPTGIRVTLDDGAWEFGADALGIAARPLPGPVRQAEGWFRRVGETRRPVVWCATPEVPA